MANSVLTEGWADLTFDDCIDNGTLPRRQSIQQRDYKLIGKYPVVDQGAELIAGYCDDEAAVYRDELPLILFGDHTRVFKFLDFPFATGADGTKLLKPKANVVQPLFLFYALRSLDLPSRGYNRHFRALREQSLSAPANQQEQIGISLLLREIEARVKIEAELSDRLTALKSATMAKLFCSGLRGEAVKISEIGPIPKSWDVVRLGALAKVGNGSTPSRTNEAYWQNGVFPWITSTKVHDVFIRAADELVSEIALRQCHLPIVPKGSLVVAITGQGKTLGNAALLEIDTCVNQHLAYIRLLDERLLPEFFLFWLQNQYQFFRDISSSGGSTKGALTCGFLANLLVPVPSGDEQRRIADLLVSLTKRQHAAEKTAQATKDLFATVLHQLMTGTVRIGRSESAEVVNA